MSGKAWRRFHGFGSELSEVPPTFVSGITTSSAGDSLVEVGPENNVQMSAPEPEGLDFNRLYPSPYRLSKLTYKRGVPFENRAIDTN
jgi:hypothetical protein